MPGNARNQSLIIVLFLIVTCFVSPAIAGEIHVAVASNFANAMKEIAQQFEKNTRHKIVLTFGATGKQYAQIKNGAPFDVYFAADAARPKRLEEEGIGLGGSRFTYAIGKIILWSPRPSLVDNQGSVLATDNFRHIAIANPKLAPYGKAAQQIMKARKVWAKLQERTVRGENISQAFQFVQSGNAELGFVAYSQVRFPDKSMKGSFWEPPTSLYEPIEQQAILLKDNAIARNFLTFVKGKEARTIIRNYGYGTP